MYKRGKVLGQMAKPIGDLVIIAARELFCLTTKSLPPSVSQTTLPPHEAKPLVHDLIITALPDGFLALASFSFRGRLKEHLSQNISKAWVHSQVLLPEVHRFDDTRWFFG